MKVLAPEKTPRRVAQKERAAEDKTNGEATSTSPTFDPLDDLRLSLMTELSHQLRTPATAMRLALDNLTSRLHEGRDAVNVELANVAGRNLDRIVDIVTYQLDLLGMALGDAPVSLQNVCLADVLDRVGEALSRVGAGIEMVRDVDNPVVAYTDPRRLQSVLTGVLVEGPRGVHRRVTIYENAAGPAIDVRLDFLGFERNRAADAGLVNPESDFEHRACEAAVRALGGTLQMRKDANVKFARIHLPGVREDVAAE